MVYTRYWLADPRRRLWRGWGVEVNEPVVMLTALRVLIWLLFGPRLDVATLRTWFLNPFTFFDLPFVLGGVMLVIAGRFAAAAATNVLALGLRPDELVDYRQLGRVRGWVQASPPDREALLEAFGETWMFGGVVLLVCVALSRGAGRAGEPGWWRWDIQGLTPTAVLALVGYLLIGLLLCSQGRPALLRARWRYEGVPGGERVLTRWHRHAILVIVLVAVLALLLPLGSTFGLAAVLLALIRAFIVLATLLVGLVALLIAWVLNLFTPETTPAPPPAMAWDVVPPWVGPGMFWLLVMAAAGSSPGLSHPPASPRTSATKPDEHDPGRRVALWAVARPFAHRTHALFLPEHGPAGRRIGDDPPTSSNALRIRTDPTPRVAGGRNRPA